MSSTTDRSTIELVLGAVTYIVIIAITICGNILVILAVFKHRPLRKVQNYFLVSLAVSDLAVAALVMPLHVVKFLADGRWLLGAIICQLFTTADILLCTSSILNLCAIAIDRYWAIHNPIDYAQKRTLRLVLLMIAAVWIISAMISIPPLIGWNDWSAESIGTHCELTTERAFVIFSASGSFFVPLFVMTVIYAKIFVAARQRIRTNRDRSALSRSMVTDNQQKHQSSPSDSAPNSPLQQRLKKSKSWIDRFRGVGEQTTPLVSHRPTTTITTGVNNLSSSSMVQIRGHGATDSIKASTSGGRLSIKRVIRLQRTEPLIEHQRVTSIRQQGQPYSEPSSGASTSDILKPTSITTNNNNNNNNHNSSTSTTTAVIESSVSTHNHDTTTSLLKRREKISVAKEKKAAKTLAIIMGVFCLCWLPFFLMYVILPFCDRCSLHPKVAEAITWLGYINSSINPIIYTIFNLEFRRAFGKFYRLFYLYLISEKFICPSEVRRKRRFSNVVV